ncbi:MAG TPA: ParB/RepB/Spo0J family partition protein [Chloroflexota bacterium]|nr:ParB/RepB/Spo0J family partition protein [Chloroflexota bacterium]
MPAPRGGLGRGLSSLIPEAKPAEPVNGGLLQVAPGQIRPNPQQPRQHFDQQALQELADSIAEHGVLQPLVVSPLPPSDSGVQEYQLIAGERRWQAAKLAQLPRVPVLVKEAGAQEALELALIENIQRADLNPLEEAGAYQQLHDEYGLTHEDIAKRVGKSRVTVTNALRLLGLPAEARKAVVDGQITEGHARVLLSLPTEAAQLRLLVLIIGRQLTVRQTEQAARAMLAEPHNALPEPDVQTAALEHDLQSLLGTKVALNRGAKGGRLTIYFYSDEELEGVISRLRK